MSIFDCGNLRWNHCCAKCTVTLWPQEGTVGISKRSSEDKCHVARTQTHTHIHTRVCASTHSESVFVFVPWCNSPVTMTPLLGSDHSPVAMVAAVWLWIILQGVGAALFYLFFRCIQSEVVYNIYIYSINKLSIFHFILSVFQLMFVSYWASRHTLFAPFKNTWQT